MNVPVLLPPLPYHREIRDYLKAHERELWQWFASQHARENYGEDLRTSLLKSTYRLAPASHPDLYIQASTAARALGLTVPVTLYQAQVPASEPNAAIYPLPDEVHIVLSGPITSLLNPVEITSVLAHELAHFHLWHADNAEFLIADRLLHTVANDTRAHAVHHETARRYRLHTEIFADRGAALVAQNLPAVVAALVKTMTGLSTVSGESYLEQAAEIFSKAGVKTSALSHPEAFIRAHALALWTKQGEAADSTIREIIAGETGLRSLDLADQQQQTQLTRRFLGQLLRPRWFQSEATLGQAKLYFPDFNAAEAVDITLVEDLRATGALLTEYFAYVLLDFAHVDRELEDAPLAATLRWAEDLGISAPFEKLVTKELGVKTRELAKLKPRIADLLALAEKGV